MKLKYNDLIFDVNGDLNNYYTKDECDNKYAKLDQSNTFSQTQSFTKENSTILIVNDDYIFGQRPEDETKRQIWFHGKSDALGVLQYIYSSNGMESLSLLKRRRDEEGNFLSVYDGLSIISNDDNPSKTFVLVPYTKEDEGQSNYNRQAVAREYADCYGFKGINEEYLRWQSATSSFTQTITKTGFGNYHITGITGSLQIKVNDRIYWNHNSKSNWNQDIMIPFKKGDTVQFIFTTGTVGSTFSFNKTYSY